MFVGPWFSSNARLLNHIFWNFPPKKGQKGKFLSKDDMLEVFSLTGRACLFCLHLFPFVIGGYLGGGTLQK